MKPTRRIRQGGFSIFELVMAFGVGSIVALGAGYVIMQGIAGREKQEELYWLEARRTELQTIFRSPVRSDGSSLWKSEILDMNTSGGIYCLREGSSGCPSGSQSGTFRIRLGRNGASNILLNGNGTQGFTANGELCTSYKSGNCVYGVRLDWRAICRETTYCRNPEPHLKASFTKWDPKTGAETSLDRYAVNVIRGQILDSVVKTCQSIQGTFNSSTGECDLSALGLCPVGEFMVGIDADGQPKCGPLSGMTCASGSYLNGFDSTGAPICVPGCSASPPAPPPATPPPATPPPATPPPAATPTYIFAVGSNILDSEPGYGHVPCANYPSFGPRCNEYEGRSCNPSNSSNPTTCCLPVGVQVHKRPLMCERP